MAPQKRKRKVSVAADTSIGEYEAYTEAFSLPISDPTGAWFRAALLFDEIEQHLGEEVVRKIFKSLTSKRGAQQKRARKLLQRLDSMKPKPAPFKLARMIAEEKYGADVNDQQIASAHKQIKRLVDKYKKNVNQQITKAAIRLRIK
jgi:hypothetical protein